MVALQILLLTVITAGLTRFLRQSDYTEGLRDALSSRSAVLEKLFRCPHCLSFWIASAGAGLFFALPPPSLSLLEFAVFLLVGWRGAHYLNRLIDKRRERRQGRGTSLASRRCPVCAKPYSEDFVERNGKYFCSHTCWFDFLKNRPRPRETLFTSKGGFVRQETYPMSYQDITPEQAKELLDKGGYAYVDVRSEPEFRNGHPAGAVNVPIMHREPMGMVPNADFLRVMEINFEHDAPVVLGCQSGGRSAKAAEVMLAAGFTAVHNVSGGFGGARNDSGTVVQKGWFELGLPVDYGDPDDRSYTAMSAGR